MSERRLVADELGDRALAHAPRELDDGADHQAVGGVGGAVAHELAVDLDEVEGQVLEVVEGAEARPEVVQREAAAELAELLGEGARRGDVVDRGGLGDLEDQLRRVDRGEAQLAADVLGELGIAQRVAGDVDLDDRAARQRRGVRRASGSPAS